MTRSCKSSGEVVRKKAIALIAVIVAIAAHGVFAEEAEKPSAAGVSMAATLLGSISFIMILYYFTNWDDKDIKRYSWEIISSTISIFCAVLLFQSFNDLVEAYIIERYEFGPNGTCITDLLHMLVWFTFLQVLLALFSGAIDVDFDSFKDRQEELEEELEKRELNMKCYATLMAHLTGFASINAWGSMQQLPFFRQDPVMAMAAIPVAFLGQLTLQRITSKIRELVCMGDDGEKDPFEDLWDDETEEAENDVMSLTCSFMTVNAWRFMIIGCMPNNEGKEKPPECAAEAFYHHTGSQKILLWGSALCFTACVFCMHYSLPAVWESTRCPLPVKLVERTVWVAVGSVSMCFSWCTFYGVQMCLAGFGMFHGEDELLSVCLALVCSLGVFSMMIPLDWLADQDWTDDRCDDGIRATMDAFALLVGFAWEQCFDTSVDALAAATQGWRMLNPHSTKLFLSFFCSGLLVPAWKWYMLPYILAKGYRFGPIGAPKDLEKICDAFFEVEDEEKISAEEIETREKLEQTISRVHAKFIKRGGSFPAYVPPTDPGVLAKLLASSEPADMKQTIVELQAALARAERERDNAQNMVAYQMEAMLENMKKMNLTVTRIP